MTDQNYCLSEKCVVPIVNNMIEKVNGIMQDRKLDQIKSTYISKDIAIKQSQSIQQIRAVVPKRPENNYQDKRPPPVKTEAIRPFSAQLKAHKIRAKFAESQNINHYFERKYSLKGLQSFRSIKSMKNPVEKTKSYINAENDKLIPLITSQQNLEEDQIIQKLRMNKMLAQEYEVKKQRFLETISKQNDFYSQSQMRFISSMGKKSYTYNYGGSIIETKDKKNKGRKLKKVTYFKSTARNSDVTEDQHQTIQVNYRKREKDSNLHKEWEMQNQKNITGLLTYKSQNAKFLIK